MVAQKVKVAMPDVDEQALASDQPNINQNEQQTHTAASDLSAVQAELAAAQAALAVAQDREFRARADYQNLVRRTQEDKGKLIKLAGKSLISDLLEPLSHLSLAADQLKDAGLSMVVKQLWQKLEQNGLQQLDVMGKPFDVTAMEATDITGEGDLVVTHVVTPGYQLNGEVIQHAKVVLGKAQ